MHSLVPNRPAHHSRPCGAAAFAWALSVLLLATPLAARTKVIVWGLQSGRESAGLDAQVAEFERRNPDIELSLMSMGAGAMNPQKLMTAIVGGVPPDVILQDRFTIGDWASRAAFRPLDDFLARDAAEPDGIREADFYPAAWREATHEGRLYAVPISIDDRMLLYNKALFREVGLDPERPPATWEELLEYAKRLTKPNPNGTYERIGFIPNFGNSWLYLYSWQNGGEFMSPDGRTCTLDNPYTVGALEYMKEVYDALGGYNRVNIFQSGFLPEEQDPFFTGKIGMVINGSWVLNSVARFAPDLELGVAPPPVPAARLRGDGHFAGQPPYITWSGGHSLAIPAGAREPEAAWRFIKWWVSEEGLLLSNKAQAEYNRSKGRPFVFTYSARPAINEAQQREFPPRGQLFAAQQAFLDMLPNAKWRPVTFVGQSLWDAHVRAFERACAGERTPAEALAEETRLVQKELDQAYEDQLRPEFSFRGPLIALISAILLSLAFGAWRVRRQLAHSRQARAEALAGYVMAGPWLFGFFVLTAGPILASLLFSFCSYDVLHAPRWVGLDNYAALVGDQREMFGKALYNAAYLSIIGIPLGMATSLSIALLLNSKVRGIGFYRTAFYIPSIVPAIASAVLWGWVLAGDPNKGLLNALWSVTLTPWFGWSPPGWFGVAEWAKPGLILQGLWGAGGGMILWLAGLQGVPRSLYEAAQLDGAGGWAQFRHVTLPMISPYVFFNLVMGTIGAVQEFDRVYVLGGGSGNAGPLDSLLVPVLYLFNNAFRYFKMGLASSIAWVIFVIILILTLIQWWSQKHWVYYEVGGKS
ncbi:MAG TPA: hypothetical protein DCZ72_04225 [Armatimonadetes bacterium]|nr:hypothetical protein [Armatimonadota bacterium]